MARSAATMAVAMVVLVAMAAMVPSVSADCDNIEELLPCLNAAKTGAVPPKNCCDAIAAYAKGGTLEGEDCLCKAVTSSTAASVGMKLEYAVDMPEKCGLSYKSGYVCDGTPIRGGHP